MQLRNVCKAIVINSAGSFGTPSPTKHNRKKTLGFSRHKHSDIDEIRASQTKSLAYRGRENYIHTIHIPKHMCKQLKKDCASNFYLLPCCSADWWSRRCVMRKNPRTLCPHVLSLGPLSSNWGIVVLRIFCLAWLRRLFTYTVPGFLPVKLRQL